MTDLLLSKEVNIINGIINKLKVLLVISLTLFSFVCSLPESSNWTALIVLVLSILGLRYIDKHNYQFENSKNNLLTILITLPMMAIDGYLMFDFVGEFGVLGFIIIAFSMFASFFLSYLIASWITNRLVEFWQETSTTEKVMIGVACIGLSIPVIVAYSKSAILGFQEFELAGSEKPFSLIDVIFVTDSGILKNAYFYLWDTENDIRQSLFALFARPIYGWSYVLSILTGFDKCGFICIFQNILLVISIFMIYKMCNPENSLINNLLIFVGCLLLFPVTMYSMVIEQYPIVFFYLILFIYHYIYKEKKESHNLGYMAATTTLITSAAFICWPKGDTVKEKVVFVIKKLLSGITTIFTMLMIYGRGGIFTSIYDKFQKLQPYGTFSDESPVVGILNKLQQYFVFVKSCFIMPETTIISEKISTSLDSGIFYKIHLIPTVGFDIAGIVICALAIIGLIIGLKNEKTIKISKLSIVWILASLFCIIVAGWGTPENGLTIYTLYFGWPFWVGIIQLINLIKSKTIKTIIYALIIIILLYFTITGYSTIINFVDCYYPRL